MTYIGDIDVKVPGQDGYRLVCAGRLRLQVALRRSQPVQDLRDLASIHIRAIVGLLGRLEVENHPVERDCPGVYCDFQ